MEDAGLTIGDSHLTTGVFAGTSKNTYYTQLLQHAQELVKAFGDNNMIVANEKDYTATRISHKLNLTGPSLSVHTACSTGMVTIHQALQSLRLHECDVALAGAATINAPLQQGYEYNEGGMYSADGHCKPFSDQSSGTVFSDGVGMVALRRLSDAQRDGDRIYAVIKGSAVNNDGANKMSFSAPSVQGQAKVITAAQINAGIDANDIDYVEAHGTGTPLGDPIEVKALTAAFNRKQILAKNSCALGSVKSNLGHLNAAAGVASFIKSALSLYHRKIPATLHYQRPNPQIDFSKTPFYVINKTWPLPKKSCKIAISALGVGGTNAHMILEEVEQNHPNTTSDEATDHDNYLLLLSTKNSEALLRQRQQLIDHLQKNTTLNLRDIAFTLHAGRNAWNERQAIVVTTNNVVEHLAKPTPLCSSHQITDGKPIAIGFMFPGQGAQYINMGQGLYQWHASYRQAIDQCHNILQKKHNIDLKALLYPNSEQRENSSKRLNQTQFTQPLMFATSYAIAKLLMALGIKPAAMLGHSIGEFVAAHLAGVFTLEDALHLVASRGALMQKLPTGSMLSVRMGEQALSTKLLKDTVIATINGPENCVVAGPNTAIHTLQQTLEKEDISCRALLTSHAFHSPMMDSVVAPFAKLVEQCQLNPPSTAIMSTVTGTWLTTEQAQDPMYWAHHLREPVRFADAVTTLWRQKNIELIECGPRATCTTLAKACHQFLQHSTDEQWLAKTNSAWPTLGSKGDVDLEQGAFLLTLGQLWVQGVDIAPHVLSDKGSQKISLPGYPFARDNHWVKSAITKNSHLQTLPPAALEVVSNNIANIPTASIQTTESDLPGNNIMSSRTDLILEKMAEVLERTSGIEIKDYPSDTDFIDIGLDSLLLTEAALNLRKAFSVELSFRQLLQDLHSPQLLAEYLDEQLPESEFASPATPIASQTIEATAMNTPVAQLTPLNISHSNDGSAVNNVIAQQIQLMQQQLQMLLGQAVTPTTHPQPTATAAAVTPTTTTSPTTKKTETTDTEKSKTFGAQAKIQRNKTAAFTPKQQKAYDAFKEAYIARTAKSRAYTIEHRAHLADPRVVTGFNPDIKDLVYNIVSDRSEGAHLWDIDGNEYIDLTGGFGCGYMGHRHPAVVEAVKKQVDEGFEIGPQHILAGKVAKQLCTLTGMDRTAFCNTGSEAVMGAMRLARTVTGKSKVVTFSGDYHGIFDEVIVRSTPNGRVFPAASGILPEAVEGAMVLPYGDNNSLDVIRENLDDIAAIMIEPIQAARQHCNRSNLLKHYVKSPLKQIFR